MNGVGASCVNALSSEFEVEIKTGGTKYLIQMEQGIVVKPVHEIEKNVEGTGTTVRYKFDKEVWKEDDVLDLNKVQKRMRQLAYLNPGLSFYVYFDTTDAQGNEIKVEETYCFPEGLQAYVEQLTKSKKRLADVHVIEKQVDDIYVSIAYAYTESYAQDVYTFVNNVATESGGDHLIGFNHGVAKAIERYALDNKLIKVPSDISLEDTKEGLTAVVSIKVLEPHFEGQGKSKIKMSNVRTAVRQVTDEHLFDMLEQDKKQAKLIIDKILMAGKARLAAKRAREATRSAKELSDSGGLPGKLSDCQSKKAEECEIYIVEGKANCPL